MLELQEKIELMQAKRTKNNNTMQAFNDGDLAFESNQPTPSSLLKNYQTPGQARTSKLDNARMTSNTSDRPGSRMAGSKFTPQKAPLTDKTPTIPGHKTASNSSIFNRLQSSKIVIKK